MSVVPRLLRRPGLPPGHRSNPLRAASGGGVPARASRRGLLSRLLASTTRGLLAGWALVLWTVIGGCDRTAESLITHEDSAENQSLLVSQTASPRTALERSTSMYKSLRSYRDAAFVRLRYQLDGQPMEDRAPLAIAWQKDGPLGILAYSVQAGPSQGRWRARLLEDDALVPNQVLSRAIPERIDFDWLLSDPVLAQQLAAGLAGFPPQLDLLLAEKPLSGLIDDRTSLSHLPAAVLDGFPCWVIQVQRDTAQWVLWLDQNSLLLRRMLLPSTHLPQDMLDDKRVSHIELSIEFVDIQTDSAVDWGPFTPQVATDDRLVNRFVPQPPAVDTQGLGEQIPGFHLESPSGETVYDTATANRQSKATVLWWLADHPTCRLACRQMQRVQSAVADLGLPEGTVAFVPVWAEPQPPSGSSFATLADDWQMPGRLALDRAALGRDLFGVQEAPTVVVVDAHNRLQWREARSNPNLDQFLPDLLARLAGGENLAEQLSEQQHQHQLRFQAELRLAAAVDAPAGGSFPEEQAYSPQTFRLRELSRRSLPAPALAACGGPQQQLWTLLENGQLLRQDMAATDPTPQAVPSGWTPTPRAGGFLAVAPQGSDLAFCPWDASRIQLFQADNRHSRTIDLAADDRVVDCQWFAMQEAGEARLAVITQGGATLLIDPNNREQLSGHAPQPPLALISRPGSAEGLAAHVVLSDGRLEPLQPDRDSLLGAPDSHLRPVSQNKSAAPAQRASRLAFQPANGPWPGYQDQQQSWLLARGWLAADEPALFLLDADLHRRWHYRIPLTQWPHVVGHSVARDPRSGLPVWAVADQAGTVHVLRSDGLVIDHFRPHEAPVGVAMVAVGDHLELTLIHRQQVVQYALEWQ